MEGELAIKYATLLWLWKWAVLPLVLGSVVGFHLVNQKEQKHGVVVWAPVMWVLLFIWLAFWIGRGLLST